MKPDRLREVAITFDDLPAISVTNRDQHTHRVITERLLSAITTCRIPAVGFVNEGKLFTDGALDPERVALLRLWLDAGLELGNHTFAHVDLHRTSLGAFQRDVCRGEGVIRGLLEARGLALRYFRHPYLHTGRDRGTKRAVDTFLAERGYRVAPVSISHQDYLFAAAYDRAVQGRRGPDAERVVAAYLPYLERQCAYGEALSRRLFGYEVRQVLLFHANRLNAECLDTLAAMLRRRGYSFVTLEHALADDAYALPDFNPGPPSAGWLSRWAMDRNVPAAIVEGPPVVPPFVRRLAAPPSGDRVWRWARRWLDVFVPGAARRLWTARQAPIPNGPARDGRPAG